MSNVFINDKLNSELFKEMTREFGKHIISWSSLFSDSNKNVEVITFFGLTVPKDLILYGEVSSTVVAQLESQGFRVLDNNQLSNILFFKRAFNYYGIVNVNLFGNITSLNHLQMMASNVRLTTYVTQRHARYIGERSHNVFNHLWYSLDPKIETLEPQKVKLSGYPKYGDSVTPAFGQEKLFDVEFSFFRYINVKGKVTVTYIGAAPGHHLHPLVDALIQFGIFLEITPYDILRMAPNIGKNRGAYNGQTVETNVVIIDLRRDLDVTDTEWEKSVAEDTKYFYDLIRSGRFRSNWVLLKYRPTIYDNEDTIFYDKKFFQVYSSAASHEVRLAVNLYSPQGKILNKQKLLRKIINFNNLKGSMLANQQSAVRVLKERLTEGVRIKSENINLRFKYDKLSAALDRYSSLTKKYKSNYTFYSNEVVLCPNLTEFDDTLTFSTKTPWLVFTYGKNSKPVSKMDSRFKSLNRIVDKIKMKQDFELPDDAQPLKTMDYIRNLPTCCYLPITSYREVAQIYEIFMKQDPKYLYFYESDDFDTFVGLITYKPIKIILWESINISYHKMSKERRPIVQKIFNPLIMPYVLYDNVLLYDRMNYRLKVYSSMGSIRDSMEPRDRECALFTVQLIYNNFRTISNINYDVFTLSNHKALLKKNEKIFDRHLLSFLLRDKYSGSLNSNIYTNKAFKLDKIQTYTRINKYLYILNPLTISTVFTIVYDKDVHPIFSIYDNHSMYVKYLSNGIKEQSFLANFNNRLGDLSFYFKFKVVDTKNFEIHFPEFSNENVRVSGHARYIFILSLFDIVDFTLWLRSVRFYLVMKGIERLYNSYNSDLEEYMILRRDGQLTEKLDKNIFEHSPVDIALGIFSVLPRVLNTSLRYKAKSLLCLLRLVPTIQFNVKKLVDLISDEQYESSTRRLQQRSSNTS